MKEWCKVVLPRMFNAFIGVSIGTVIFYCIMGKVGVSLWFGLIFGFGMGSTETWSELKSFKKEE